MGFNRTARREAAAQQQAAYAQQQAVWTENQRQIQEYQRNFDTRNASMIQMLADDTSWFNKYKKGVDVSQLLPANVALGQQTSDMVKGTVAAMGRMGDASQLPNDAGYQSKLNSVMGARLGKGLAAIQSDALANREAGVRDSIAQNSSYLNADRQAGIGMQGQLFQMSNQIWQNATTRRQMEIQVAQQAMGNLMGWVQMGVGAVSGFAGAFGNRGQAGGGAGSPSGPMYNTSTGGSFAPSANFGGSATQAGWGNSMAGRGRNPFGR